MPNLPPLTLTESIKLATLEASRQVTTHTPEWHKLRMSEVYELVIGSGNGFKEQDFAAIYFEVLKIEDYTDTPAQQIIALLRTLSQEIYFVFGHIKFNLDLQLAVHLIQYGLENSNYSVEQIIQLMLKNQNPKISQVEYEIRFKQALAQ